MRYSLVALGVALTLPAGAPALAQDKAPAESELALEEVVVTARKVEENLMTVPLAITAFSAKDIEAQGIKQLNDVMLMTPSFNFVNQQGGSGRNDRSANALVFRGLFLSGNVGLNAGGQLFIDGAPVIGAQPPATVDVERIEVLKGPQSAYFGRSTFVGAINFVTRNPSDEFKGKVSAELSRFSSHDVSASIEGPVFTDKLRARVSLRDFDRGGQYRNTGVSGGDLGGQTTKSASLTLLWQPAERFSAKLFVNGFEDDDEPPAQGALKSGEFNGRVAGNGSCIPFSQAPSGTAATVPGVPNTTVTTITQAANGRPSFGYYCGTLPQVDQLASNVLSADYDYSEAVVRNALYSPNPNWLIFDPSFKKDGGIKRRAFQADLRLDWEFGSGYKLSALTATHQEKTQTLIDLNYRDGHDRANPCATTACLLAPGVFANPALAVSYRKFLLMSQNRLRDVSQEIRLSSPSESQFRWMIGGNYLKAKSPGGTVYGQCTTGPCFTAAITRQQVTTPAVFGAVYYDFNEKLTLSVEGRQQWDKIEQTPYVNTAGALVQPPLNATLKSTFKSFSPRVSLDYEYRPNSTIYALFSRGYRPGGFNAALATSTQATIDFLRGLVPSAGLTFDQEQLDNYEVGIKSTWLEGRARTTFTVYSDEWIDGQVSNSIPVPGVTNLIALTYNNGTAQLDGFEFEGQFRATGNLTLSATFGFNDSKIKSYGVVTGNLVGGCSDCNFIFGSFAGALGKRLPTVPQTTWTLSADYQGTFANNLRWYARGDFQHQGSKYTDFTNIAKVGDKENLNARFGLRGEKWSAEIFGTNLLDDDVMQSALLGIDVFTFLPGGTPNRNELRFSPGLPRMFGARVTYEF